MDANPPATLKKWPKPRPFDRNLVVIGAGAAGLVTAYIAAAVKAKVSLIEKHKMGGDCLNTGCVPSKALIRTAKLLSHIQRAKEFGIRNHRDNRIEMDDNGTDCGTQDPLDQIRLLYTELALRPDKEFGWGKDKGNGRQLGYADDWLARLPDVVWESAAAVGNPFAIGPVHPGETVVDLGCGAGADACVAALLVGDKGKVYGIDATPAMVAKATSNAKAAGLSQIEFREADMIYLGLPDAIADVVISNGAINLTLDKPKAFAEVFRILRRGGRFQFADMVREHGAMGACCGESSWADCISGTMGVDKIKILLHEAGFVDAQLVEFTGYKTSPSTVGATFKAHKA